MSPFKARPWSYAARAPTRFMAFVQTSRSATSPSRLAREFQRGFCGNNQDGRSDRRGFPAITKAREHLHSPAFRGIIEQPLAFPKGRHLCQCPEPVSPLLKNAVLQELFGSSNKKFGLRHQRAQSRKMLPGKGFAYLPPHLGNRPSGYVSGTPRRFILAKTAMGSAVLR